MIGQIPVMTTVHNLLTKVIDGKGRWGILFLTNLKNISKVTFRGKGRSKTAEYTA